MINYKSLIILALFLTQSISLEAANKKSVWKILKPWYGDTETSEQRLDRLKVISNSINKSVDRAKKERRWRGRAEDLRWLLITQAFFETRLAQHVHEDKCRVKKGECDSGKAKSLWQIQKASNALNKKGWWDKIGGDSQESTDNAAWAATIILSRAHNMCKSLPGTISLYATGKTCFWPEAKMRSSWLNKVRKRYSSDID